jgi:hypothetical protein
MTVTGPAGQLALAMSFRFVAHHKNEAIMTLASAVKTSRETSCFDRSYRAKWAKKDMV